MAGSWTFGQKIAAGFTAMVMLVIVIAGGAVYGIRTVAESKDRVIAIDARNLILAGNLRAAIEWKSSAFRGFLLTSDAVPVARYRAARQEFLETLRSLRAQGLNPEGSRLVGEIEQAEATHHEECERLIVSRQGGVTTAEAASQTFTERVMPKMNDLRERLGAFVAYEERLLAQGTRDATASADLAAAVLVGLALSAVLLAVVLALVLTRMLGRQIGSAVQHVQSSSSELQTAAHQQATGSKEQATAMNEITTTITELLATSKQIAESAQRVAHIAEDTAKAARTGEQTVSRTNESIGSIKRQVELIVTHMLDLGKKSQQIGSILEIINELAEQTNILAINATIEAAGAGESGKRFAVVADEIRKLADRVGGSTKEIRGLIDEIRAAVNTTVMTTEGGTKAVDAGAQKFAEVAAAFVQIASLVGTTTEAAREIELSTKQQSTAVEQVKIAVANVAQVSRETEASSSQTFQTASQLTTLSRDLLRLVQPQATA